ncbi:MAG: hypothetical protein K0U21_03490 [Proteobacteria bacterium]|nr:hypothetical protein [Pseudomonadota bacterium]
MTTIDILLNAGYEIEQAHPMGDDGWFEIILNRGEQRATLYTDEPWSQHFNQNGQD